MAFVLTLRHRILRSNLVPYTLLLIGFKGRFLTTTNPVYIMGQDSRFGLIFTFLPRRHLTFSVYVCTASTPRHFTPHHKVYESNVTGTHITRGTSPFICSCNIRMNVKLRDKVTLHCCQITLLYTVVEQSERSSRTSFRS